MRCGEIEAARYGHDFNAWRRLEMKKLVATMALVAFAAPAMADGYTDCTKEPKEKWAKKQDEAEAEAKKAGYDVRRSKIEGFCYEVYGVKDGTLYELFYSPMDLTIKHTIKKG